MKIIFSPQNADGDPVDDIGDIAQGDTPLDVVKFLMNPPWFTMNVETDPDRFIDDCLKQIRDFSGLILEAPGDSPEERAASFIRVLIDNRLARRLN
jgi:hypothetical protein